MMSTQTRQIRQAQAPMFCFYVHRPPALQTLSLSEKSNRVSVISGYDWRKLAARMRLDFFIPLLHKRKGYSPTELLLQKWQIEGKF